MINNYIPKNTLFLKKDFTQGNPGKVVLTFALPMLIGNIFQQLYTVVDTAIVGRGVGMDALAALGTVDAAEQIYGAIMALRKGKKEQ